LFGRTALDLKEELEDFVRYVALAFARADLRPPLIAAWTANVIFMGIGVSLLLRART
jgi:lipopolysaccharide export LptBFGC system permease protein LptF